MATHSIRLFPLHFPSRASPCATRFRTSSTYTAMFINTSLHLIQVGYTYIHTHIHIYIYIYTRTHTHTHIYIYIHTHTCVCVCVCVCVCLMILSLNCSYFPVLHSPDCCLLTFRRRNFVLNFSTPCI